MVPIDTSRRIRFVVFVNRGTAEEIHPLPSWGIISVTDSKQDEANLREGWGYISRHHFIDEYYNDETLDLVGPNYKFIYSSYFDRDKAYDLKKQIAALVDAEVDVIVVHCHAGRSRSAAIAKYIVDRFDYYPHNSLEILGGTNERAGKSRADLFSRMNDMVYTLLVNPNHFDKKLAEIDDRTRVNKNPRSEFHKILSKLRLI